MSKKNEYRFNLRFDETDEDHRKVCQFLNDYCGSRKKARYIVKAVLAYWKLENKSIELTSKPQVISALPKEQSVPLAVEEENNKEPNRFQRMLVTHPNHYNICMNLKNNGVRYEDALHDCGIPTKTWEQAGQLSLDLKNAA